MNKQLLHLAIDTYGIDAQLDMVVEEMSELTKEICKYKRGKSNLTEITEEIADVTIMLEQMKIIFNLNDSDIKATVDVKLDRLSKRLECKKYCLPCPEGNEVSVE